MKKFQTLSQKVSCHSSFQKKSSGVSGTGSAICHHEISQSRDYGTDFFRNTIPNPGEKRKKSENSSFVKLRHSHREVPVSSVKRERVFPEFLTEQEIEEAKCYLGIFLPPECQKRYEEIYRQKVEAHRLELEIEEWQNAQFPE